ncbi:MAG: hypothetical protein ACLT2Z_01570 [Eubacterium sp.]
MQSNEEQIYWLKLQAMEQHVMPITTSPAEDGSGAAKAMEFAMNEAGNGKSIDYKLMPMEQVPITMIYLKQGQ